MYTNMVKYVFHCNAYCLITLNNRIYVRNLAYVLVNLVPFCSGCHLGLYEIFAFYLIPQKTQYSQLINN